MPTTIRGPLTIGPNGDMNKIAKKFKEAGAEFPLPFKATGFKANNMPIKINDNVSIKTEETVKPPKAPKEKPKKGFLSRKNSKHR